MIIRILVASAAIGLSVLGAPVTANAAVAPFPLSSSCDSNYSGACVPVDSDVDCAGGSGNGPSYVSGPVQVVGNDIYKLDNNGDGVGCE